MKIYNFGSINVDEIYQVEDIVRPGETISSIGFHTALGGKGLNQSVAIARSGGNIHHIGFINEKDTFIKQFMEEEKIVTSNLELIKTETGKAVIQLSKDGENSIVINSGANFSYDKTMINDILKNTEEKSMIITQNETNEIDYLLRRAKELGHITAINMAPITDACKNIDLNNVDYLIVNEIEGEALTNENEPNKILDNLLNRFKDIKVVLTQGSLGVMYKDKDVSYQVDAWKSAVVDTTGAGDTFVGYFLSCLSRYSIEESLKLANAASSIAIETLGASNAIPQFNMVEKKLYDN